MSSLAPSFLSQSPAVQIKAGAPDPHPPVYILLVRPVVDYCQRLCGNVQQESLNFRDRLDILLEMRLSGVTEQV